MFLHGVGVWCFVFHYWGSGTTKKRRGRDKYRKESQQLLQANMHEDKESKTQMYKMNKETQDISVQLE